MTRNGNDDILRSILHERRQFAKLYARTLPNPFNANTIRNKPKEHTVTFGVVKGDTITYQTEEGTVHTRKLSGVMRNND